MVALLRHIYDLPYQRDGRDGGEKWPVDLNDSVTLWVTAGKYLMKDVQDAATRDIRSLSRYHHNQGVISDVPHFLAALRNIIACTSHEDDARKYMVTACIKNLTLLRKDDEFMSLLRESGELGAEIIGDKDLDRALLGSWMCGRMCEKTPEPQCSDCGYRFFVDSAWNQRHLPIGGAVIAKRRQARFACTAKKRLSGYSVALRVKSQLESTTFSGTWRSSSCSDG